MCTRHIAVCVVVLAFGCSKETLIGVNACVQQGDGGQTIVGIEDNQQCCGVIHSGDILFQMSVPDESTAKPLAFVRSKVTSEVERADCERPTWQRSNMIGVNCTRPAVHFAGPARTCSSRFLMP